MEENLIRYNCRNFCLEPNGVRIAVSKYDSGIVILDSETGNFLKEIMMDHIYNRILWSPSDDFILFRSGDKYEQKINVLDINKEKIILSIPIEGRFIKDFQWNSDGSAFAVLTQRDYDEEDMNNLFICDLEKKSIIKSLNICHKCYDFDWSPDNNKIIYGENDYDYFDGFYVYVFDLNMEKVLLRFNSHNDILEDIKWSYDNKTFASCSRDGTIRVWNTDDIVSTPKEMEYENNVQIYPNPFSERCIIRYELEQAGNVQLRIFNSVGEVVDTQNPGYQAAGMHQFNFSGAGLPAGMYYFTLQAGSEVRTGIMALVK